MAAFPSPSRRRVLVVRDESMHLYQVMADGVREMATLPAVAACGPDALAAALRANRLPVVVLLDLQELHFRREDLPPLSILDLQKVMKRRLALAFPSFTLKAALPLRSRPSSGERPYLFAGVPDADPLIDLLTQIETLGVPTVGPLLLPIEAVDLTDRLIAGLAVKNDAPENGTDRPPAWGMLMSRQGNGGLRQIVVRDGNLALTRFTTSGADLTTPEGNAGDLAEELRAVLSYLSRLGHTKDEGLDLVALTDPETAAILAEFDLPVRSLTCLSPLEAAARVGLAGSRWRDGAVDADRLYGAWVAGRRQPTLSLETPTLRAAKTAATALTAANLALTGLALSLAGWSTVTQWEIAQVEEAQAPIRAEVYHLREEVAEARANLAGYPVDPGTISAISEIYDGFHGQAGRVFPLLDRIGASLGHEIRLRQLVWELKTPAAGKQRPTAATAAPPPPQDAITLLVDLEAARTTEIAVKEADALTGRLQWAFPDFAVIINRHAAMILPDQHFSESFGTLVTNTEQPALSAELRIEGPKK